MSATRALPISIPPWVEHVALPKYPSMPLAGFVLLAFGVALLLLGYFTSIKKVRTLFAALALLAYYPLSYVAHWFLFRFDTEARTLREPTRFEEYLYNHTRVMDWTILGICAFFGLAFIVWALWAMVRQQRKPPRELAVSAIPNVPRPIPQPVARSPQAPQMRKVVKKPPTPPASDNPFNFK